MKKLLGIVVLGLLWCNVGFGSENYLCKYIGFNCDAFYKDKNTTVKDVLNEIHINTGVHLKLHKTLVTMIKGIGGGDVSSDTHDVKLEIIKYIDKKDMEYGIQFYMEQCNGNILKKGWF